MKSQSLWRERGKGTWFSSLRLGGESENERGLDALGRQSHTGLGRHFHHVENCLEDEFLVLRSVTCV